MDTGQLVAAIAAMWAAFLSLGGGAMLFLREQIKQRDAQLEKERKAADDREDRVRQDCAAQVAKYEEKLDESSEMILRQAESQIAQVSALQQTVQTLQALLDSKGVAK